MIIGLVFAIIHLAKGEKWHMSYTSFGEYMRVLRIKNHELMSDIAELLNVSVPFLSAVENGKKNVPSDWIPKIVEHYNLNEAEQQALIDAIEESKTYHKLNTLNAGPLQRKAALQFVRSFATMDDDTSRAILRLLKNKAH